MYIYKLDEKKLYILHTNLKIYLINQNIYINKYQSSKQCKKILSNCSA